ncbi:MAG TPA: GMC family oxidoreductase [Bryobacterales bacterium]|jgi:choline dehydrogenase-like flavoprotein|nr:GMC family oxidoreductase [Bryobacterales bacterium]
MPQQNNPEVDLRKVYDAIVVGSGAAGGMAAHVLTSHGMQVLLLEAGPKLDIDKELKSMEWPYDHPRRGDMPPGRYALTRIDYRRNPPYAQGSRYDHVHSYVQSWDFPDYSKNIVVDEKDHPFTGTPFAWVRARCLGGKTNIWGRLSLRLSDYDFKAKTHDGYGEDWPISYADLAPYYDKVDLYLGISGHKENLPQLPDGLFQRSHKLNWAELHLRKTLASMGRTLTPYRAGVTTDGLKHNKYRSRCFGRGACSRRVGGCDIHAAFDSPTGLIYPAMDTGNLTLRPNSIVHEILVDKNTGKASGVAFLDAESRRSYQARARVVVVGASTLESARLLLLSKSPAYPNGIGNSSGHVGHNLCEHLMGPGVSGIMEDLVGKAPTLDDGRPGGFYIPRFRNLSSRHPNFIRGYGFEGGSGSQMFPGNALSTPGFGAAYKKEVRDYAGASISMSGFGEVLARYENYVDLDPEVKDRWGIPVLRFHYQFGDNEKKMAADMADAAGEMFEAAGFKNIRVRRNILTEGWSIHELGTARMGSDPKTSVLNQFQQSHDVKNLFVVDGSSHVSASCQNPTWTIMALCWRSCDYLADQFKKGNL